MLDEFSTWEQLINLADRCLLASNLVQAEITLVSALAELDSYSDSDEKDSRVATTLQKLGLVLILLDKVSEAGQSLQRCLELRIKTIGPYSLETAQTMSLLTDLYCSTVKYSEAERLCYKLVDIFERRFGRENETVAMYVSKLAGILHSQEKFKQAEQEYKKALAIKSKLLSNSHPEVVDLVKQYATLLQMTHREAEAEQLLKYVDGFLSGRWKV